MTHQLIPVGLQTPEGVDRVNAAKEELERAEGESSRVLDRLHSDIYSGTSIRFAWDAEREAVKAAVLRRRQAFDNFARAVCGAPVSPTADSAIAADPRS